MAEPSDATEVGDGKRVSMAGGAPGFFHIPTPSSPTPLLPQHVPLPSANTAHVAPNDAVTATALEIPGTSVGGSESVRLPRPSWPNELAPQHRTLPAPLTRQVW